MALHVFQKPKDEFESRLIKVDRVTRVTGGGKRFNFRVFILVGNRQGLVGIGIAKSPDMTRAIEKATRYGKKNLVKLPLQDGTIPFRASAKYRAAELTMRPARGGGLIAGGIARHICELGGVKHINIKFLARTKNTINNARAVMKTFDKIAKMRLVRSQGDV